MKVAIIGTGNMGTGLGRQLAAAGHEVIVGSRDPERARAKAEEIGAGAHGTYADAIAQAEHFSSPSTGGTSRGSSRSSATWRERS